MTNQQNSAWLSVCSALDKHFPGWQELEETSSASACEAIRRLAEGGISLHPLSMKTTSVTTDLNSAIALARDIRKRTKMDQCLIQCGSTIKVVAHVSDGQKPMWSTRND